MLTKTHIYILSTFLFLMIDTTSIQSAKPQGPFLCLTLLGTATAKLQGFKVFYLIKIVLGKAQTVAISYV